MLTPEDVTKPALCRIAHHSVANLTGSHDTKAIDGTRIRQGEKSHIARGDTSPALLHDGKVLARSEPNRGAELIRHGRPGRGCLATRSQTAREAGYRDETVSRFRPLARRRLRTMRPFLVRIRTMNPWVRARRRRFG